MIADLPFTEIWGVDFEFISDPGERPVVVCMVAREFRSGRLIRLWHDELPAQPPFPVGDDSLVIAYAITAELNCFLELGWPMPTRMLDLHFEYLARINGRPIAARGDDDPLGSLLERMLPAIRARPKGLGRALFRARYAAAVAHMEAAGTPIDVQLLGRLRASWDGIKLGLIAAVDGDYGIYEGTTFKMVRFAAWLKRERIPWHRTESGRFSLEQDTFHEMGRAYPKVAALGDLLHAMGKLRLESLAVGSDCRNCVSLMPFRAKTGRNQRKRCAVPTLTGCDRAGRLSS